MKRAGWLFSLFVFVAPVRAETFRLEGRMSTRVKVLSEKNYIPVGAVKELTLRYTRYPDRTLGANSQKIVSETETFSFQPREISETVDAYGNKVVKAVFKNLPPEGVKHSRVIEAQLEARPGLVPGGDPYPPGPFDAALKPYLQPSELVQSDNPRIVEMSQKLIRESGARTYAQVVNAELNFVVGWLRGELSPPSKDAVWALTTGRGNCQCYSHLSAALLRAAGIPARVAVGLATKKAWSIDLASQGRLTQDNAQGLHAWLEVYYPSVGWVPGDPQQTHDMVASRLLTQCQGPDAGLVVDRAEFAGSGSIKREDKLEVDFPSDEVELRTVGTTGDPAQHYIVEAFKAEKAVPPPPAFTATAPPPSPTPSPAAVVPGATPRPTEAAAPSRTPTAAPRPTAPGQDIQQMLAKIQKDRESAERDQLRRDGYLGFTDKDPKPGDEFAQDMDVYATSDKLYAQKFTVPMDFSLTGVELALCKFGGEDGSIWVEVHEDREGKPGMGPTDVVSSRGLGVAALKFDRSYPWTRFSGFAKRDSIPLKAGAYWIVLRYSGDAIFNWRCQMGNYYGDNADTRAGASAAPVWKELVNIDLNFKVLGTPL